MKNAEKNNNDLSNHLTTLKKLARITKTCAMLAALALVALSADSTDLNRSVQSALKSEHKTIAQDSSHEGHGHLPGQPCTFFPPNKLRFPVRPTGHMSELTFNRVFSVVQQVYQPIFQKNGRPRFTIVPRWTDDTVNAFAFVCNDPSKIGTQDYPAECSRMQTSPGIMTPLSIIVMFGGLARHPLMTPEGMIIVACHEIGHHLGGFPRYDNNTSWAATEGQSDYFATAKCARKVFTAIGNNLGWSRTAAIPFEVRQSCQQSFGLNTEQSAICMRSSLAGLTLARVLGTLAGTDPRVITYANVDRSVVAQTYEGHPKAQCRLDTYYAGSTCQVSEFTDFSPLDPRPGACVNGRVQNRGIRPSCWFKNPLPN